MWIKLVSLVPESSCTLIAHCFQTLFQSQYEAPPSYIRFYFIVYVTFNQQKTAVLSTLKVKSPIYGWGRAPRKDVHRRFISSQRNKNLLSLSAEPGGFHHQLFTPIRKLWWWNLPNHESRSATCQFFCNTLFFKQRTTQRHFFFFFPVRSIS